MWTILASRTHTANNGNNAADYSQNAMCERLAIQQHLRKKSKEDGKQCNHSHKVDG